MNHSRLLPYHYTNRKVVEIMKLESCKIQYDISFQLPLAIVGASGTGKTFLVKDLIRAFGKERRVMILNPHSWGDFNGIVSQTVPVRMWLPDNKYRFPTKAQVVLLEDQYDKRETALEVIERITNISEQEKLILVVDSIAENENVIAEKLYEAQSDNLFCVMTSQTSEPLNLSAHEVQVITMTY